tara:strand:+ start:423 stop:728 length:306 start_codon:yes stop_codon:yes gene_type:complete
LLVDCLLALEEWICSWFEVSIFIIIGDQQSRAELDLIRSLFIGRKRETSNSNSNSNSNSYCVLSNGTERCSKISNAPTSKQFETEEENYTKQKPKQIQQRR